MYTLRLGNSLQVLPTLPSNSIDSIVCDPPYELGFMGKSWDASGIAYNVQLWQEALRVLKPGGHLLAFSGSRTYHRMTCAIEDAGFEVRDQILWVYGSGFPKSLDVSKAIDKAAGAEREVIGTVRAGIARKTRNGGEIVGSECIEELKQSPVTAPATEAAKQWQGWGTALKPAHEPICVARKPPAKGLTVASNVLAHGTGALNIDGCRVPSGQDHADKCASVVGASSNRNGNTYGEWAGERVDSFSALGRWPANLIHDGSDEVLALFPDVKCGMTKAHHKSSTPTGNGVTHGSMGGIGTDRGYGDTGSAARFFYCAKTSKKDRNEGCEEVTTWEHADLKELIRGAHLHLKGISETTMRLLDDHECSMMWCGNSTTEQFPTGLMYTIRTVTRLITESRTWKPFPDSTINASILGAIKTLTGNGLNPAESAELLSRFLPSITDERTVSALGAVLAVLKVLLPISESARKGNVHSTVKPTDLMRYLCRLVTPPGGVVLDPFMGSGSTGKAAILEGFRFTGIEMNEEYMAIAAARISNAFESTIADMI